jgi:hypothetical protein
MHHTLVRCPGWFSTNVLDGIGGQMEDRTGHTLVIRVDMGWMDGRTDGNAVRRDSTREAQDGRR